MSIDVNVQNDLVIVTESSEDIVVNVSNAAGAPGPAGANGVGVPVGGATGQVLKKFTNTDFDTYWAADASGLTSVGLSMPTAFTVSNTPLTTNGTIAVTGAGTAAQYVRGDGQLATFPSTASGGSSVNYYLNGSINASVAGYKQLSNTATIGGGFDFTLVGNGLIAQFLTDVGNPNRIEIPGGAWNFEMFFQVSSSGGNQKFYVELLKYNGTTFTSIASSSAVPEEITGGTSIDLYLTSLAVPTTALLITDRLAIRVYIVDNSGGRTVTLHTEDNTLCEIITTFAGGIAALNGLTANTQYLATGTSGMDFNISSLTDTHTFNLPTASATNRGALSSADWSTFNSKVPSIRTITINGTTQDLSADRSFTVSAANIYTADGTLTSARSLTHGGFNLSFIGSSFTNRFTAAGRLLLGTVTESTFLLDVNGTARVSGDFTNTGSYIQVPGSNGLQIGFNDGTNTPTTKSNISITNSGTGGVGFPQAFPVMTGLRNIYIVGTNNPSAIGSPTISGSSNLILGNPSINNPISGSNNILVYSSGQISTGNGNTAIGNAALNGINSGSNNLHLTIGAGLGNGAFTNSLSNSVYIGDPVKTNNNTTVAGDVVITTPYGQSTQFWFGGKSDASDIYFNIPVKNGTNQTGWNSYNRAGIGTGTGDAGKIIFQHSTPLTSGSTIHTAFTDTLTLERTKIYTSATVNTILGSSTDTGLYKLDVNGTARVSGALLISGSTGAVAGSLWSDAANGLALSAKAGTTYDFVVYDKNGVRQISFGTSGFVSNAGTYGGIKIGQSGSPSVFLDATFGLAITGTGTSIDSALFERSGLNFAGINSSGNFRIGAYNSTYNASAILEAVSTTKGFLPPRMTTSEKNAIASPATGLQVYDTTLNSISVYDGATWRNDNATLTTNRQTASYTLALSDRGKLVEMNVAGANNLTVPLNSSIAFPIGTKIDLSQYGAGQTTVVATGGVTVRSAGGALKLALQYSGASLVKIATDEWYLFGDITV